MVIYLYDENYFYTSAAVAPVNPKRPSESLPPMNSTEVKPPEGYAVELIPLFNFENSTWSLVDSPYKIAADEQLAKEEADALADAEEAQRALDVVNSNKTTDSGIYLFKELPDGSFYEKTAEEVATEEQALLDYTALLTIRNTMNYNIITKAKEITLGTTTESMQAFTAAFNLRATNPAEYVAEGLQVHYAITGYVLGSALDTVEKVTEYYTKILIELDKFRNSEINNYLAAKAAL